jgi:hypothetical protein
VLFGPFIFSSICHLSELVLIGRALSIVSMSANAGVIGLGYLVIPCLYSYIGGPDGFLFEVF